MYCRMNVYNGNTRYDNHAETRFACGCQSDEYQTLYQIVPVNVSTNVCVDNDTIDNAWQNGCGYCRRCARRSRCY